ncbi:hypothetical protein WJX79_010609 [Trebouxia sp. C0005]|nr:MAG: hypothetical protein FRX49_03291 [Trebouxia sp. A1-2]
MDPKSLASEITRAGADKVLEENPKRIDDAAVNKVIKQGANALESGASKGTVDPAVGAAAEGVRHSKPDEVTKEIKAQLKEQVQPSDSSLAETIVAAGKQKLAKKPEDKQSALTGGSDDQTAKEIIFEAQSHLDKQQKEEHGGVVRGSDAAKVQSIASKLREPEHATPPIVQEVKDQIKGQETLDSTAGEKKSSSGPNEQQERLTDKILSEGLEKVDRRPLDKQAEITSGTPIEVAKKLVTEAESNIGKKEYDANDGLVRHSDATKIQSIADRVKLHGDRDTPPAAVKHVADAVRQLGISDKPEE